MNLIKQLLAKLNLSSPDQKINPLSVLILPIISLVIGIILSVLVIIPQLLTYYKTSNTINETNAQVANLQSKASILESVPLENYQSGFDIALKALPAERDFIIASAQLQLLAASAGVSLITVNFADFGSNESYQIKADASGKLENIKNFLKLIDSSPRVMKIASLETTVDKDNSIQTTLSINAQLQPLIKGKQLDQASIQFDDQDQAMLAKLSQSLGELISSISQNISQGSGRPDPFQ